MTLLLDVAPAIFLFIPLILILFVIAAIGVAVFFLVRALLRKKNAKTTEAK